jgi:hypothetical protein
MSTRAHAFGELDLRRKRSWPVSVYYLGIWLEGLMKAKKSLCHNIWGCIQKFPDWPLGARTANGTALCHWVQLYRYFVSQSSEFCRHNPLCFFSTSVYCCLFRDRISPETFGYTLVRGPSRDTKWVSPKYKPEALPIQPSCSANHSSSRAKRHETSQTLYCTDLEHVEAVRVAEVPAADLCAHVPAVERSRRELEAPTVEQHVRDSRQCVPAQVQLLEPFEPANRKVTQPHVDNISAVATICLRHLSIGQPR